MKRLILMVLAAGLSVATFAQQDQPKPGQPPSQSADTARVSPEAKPEDVQSIDTILKALYDVISGPPGPRDWNRFHSLFLPEAHLIFSGKRPDGNFVHRAMTPQEYQERSGAVLQKEGFFESSIANMVDQFGTIAHVFSTYESRHQKGGQPFARGINSIQLLNDGKRWWLVNVLWDSESPDNPIPEKYLK